MKYSGEYVPPILTVDTVVFQLIEKELSVLLIRRSQEPFKDSYALPGGYNAAGETTHQAMARVLKAKAGIAMQQLRVVEQLFTFDTVARDPRGHAVSVTYMGLGKDIVPKTSAGSQSPQFFPVKLLPALAYDHKKIISYALNRLKDKISYTNAIFAVLPESFTLTQLQKAYEIILDKSLDKRNFRKKFLELHIITPTHEYFREGAHRPARLYKFNSQTVEPLALGLTSSRQ